jgi:DNA-binding MarR family transcriptional regulator
MVENKSSGEDTLKEPNCPADASSLVNQFEEIAPLSHHLGRTLWAFKMLYEKEFKVSGMAIRILFALTKQDGMTQNYLTSYLQVDPSMITRTVKEMEQERGWLRRERDPQDNRLMRVYLTDKGREQAEILPKRAAELEQRLTSQISEKELTEIRNILQILHETARHELGS